MKQVRSRRNHFDVSIPRTVSRRFEDELRQLLESRAEESFKCSYLRDEIFSKYLDPSLVTPAVRRAAAIARFKAAEQRNERTNFRLMFDEPNFEWVTYDSLVRRIRKKISWILGPLAYPEVLRGATFTNGASTRVPRSETASARKLTDEVHISSSAVKHWLAAFSGSRLSILPLTIMEQSVLFTVPKKSDIDRCACKEPEGNALLQRSVGQHIRRSLLKVGVNLTDQTKNQKLASRGWADGLATIDLSSASDTISAQLVIELLPPEWWSLLNDLRVHSTVIDGEAASLEMFSSMGNGFTFELETLIFYAITQVVAEVLGHGKSGVSVYGDDIICSTKIVPRLTHVLFWFGFIPNQKKTHYKGPFRESCGRHYWKGFDVTPFYLRKRVSTLPELINSLNHLLEWDGRGWGFFTCESTALFWQRWASIVPKALWGGISPSDPSALVTGHPPRKRLTAISKSSGYPEEGALRLWMLSADSHELVANSQFRLGLTRDDLRGSFRISSGYDPSKEVAWKLSRVIHCGERSDWVPHAAFAACGLV